jgi:hypothetical protein
MHPMSRFRAKPMLHVVLAAAGLVVVLAAVVPHWADLGRVVDGRDDVHGAVWYRVAEAATIFALLNAAVLVLVGYKSQRARSRRASAMRQDWLVARAEARLNAKSAAAHAATASWVPAPAPVTRSVPPPILGPAEMVGPQPPAS